MPRPKAFDPHDALNRATACFRRHGFAASSVGDLTTEMGIGRQSLYATYGDKHALFLEALRQYAAAMIARFARWLDGADDPLAAIRSVLREIARFAASPEGVDGCFMTNSAADLAAHDPEVRAILAAAYREIEDLFARSLRRARKAGALPRERDPRALARFLVTFIQGLRVMGTTRPNPKRLSAAVEPALRCLA